MTNCDQLEGQGSTWEATWEASERHLGGIWGYLGAKGVLGTNSFSPATLSLLFLPPTPVFLGGRPWGGMSAP